MVTYFRRVIINTAKRQVDNAIEKIIYGDVLAVINFSMDFLSLYVTARLMHVPPSPKRLTWAAVLGAAYSLLAVALSLSGIIGGILSLATAFLLTFIAFGKQKNSDRLKNTAVFYLVSFALGGGITAVCNILNVWQNKKEIMINGTFDTVYGDIPFGLLILLAGACGLFSLISGRLVRKKAATAVCTVELTVGEESVVFQALADTGNLLNEPISGKPVVIASLGAVRRLIPVGLIPLFSRGDTTAIETNRAFHVRVIPLSTVSGGSILYGFMPDRARIDGKLCDVYVALSPDTSDYGGYPAIVPFEILQ